MVLPYVFCPPYTRDIVSPHTITLDVQTVATRYGLLIFAPIFEKVHLKKEFVFVPWIGVHAWELIDIDKPRRIVMLSDVLAAAKKLKIKFGILKSIKVRNEYTFENPFDVPSKYFDEILYYLRSYAQDKEYKGLEKYGSYPIVKRYLEKAEVIGIEEFPAREVFKLVKKPDESEKYPVIGAYRQFVRFLDYKEGLPDCYGDIVEAFGVEKVVVYYTDIGVIAIPDELNFEWPKDRVYHKPPKNSKHFKKCVEVEEIIYRTIAQYKE